MAETPTPERCPRANCKSQQRWPRPRVMNATATQMVYCDDDWHSPPPEQLGGDYQRDLVPARVVHNVEKWCREQAELSEANAAEPDRDVVMAALDEARAMTLRQVLEELEAP